MKTTKKALRIQRLQGLDSLSCRGLATPTIYRAGLAIIGFMEILIIIAVIMQKKKLMRHA